MKKLIGALILSLFIIPYAHAEYYISNPCCEPVTCLNCEGKKVYRHKHIRTVCSTKRHYVKHYRPIRHYVHHYRKKNSYSIAVYDYYPVQNCGCRTTWVEGGCRCGHYVPGHWQSERNYVTFSSRPVSYHSETYYTDYPERSADRATMDDMGAELQIN